MSRLERADPPHPLLARPSEAQRAVTRPQKVHASFIEMLANKIDDVKEGRAAVDDQLVVYLQNWLKNHIRGTDFREYPK